jgi:hypothetical protein
LSNAWLLCAPEAARAQEGNSGVAAAEFFENRVRPVLVENCYRCHSAKAKKLKGGLRVDSRESLLAGGDNGPAIVPGHPDKSRLIEAIGYENADLRMPPKGKLPPQAIADLRKWVERGAPWGPSRESVSGPTPEKPNAASAAFDLQKRKREHWAWQPIRPTQPPFVKQRDWPRSAVDAFILARLEEKRLSPAPEADRRTLLRRVYFDLIGLPPPPAVIESFVRDRSPDTLPRVVDRLLASEHFGERWGRHWLDLVRYAETRGHEYDYPAPNAYQYRDYVIRALNGDVPYNQFVLEHIAGDLLQPPRLNPAQGFNESILGTGFWFLGEELHSPVDLRQDEADRFDNRIDVLTKTFLGLTVACARCHDHKFDAISAGDYYALFGFLESSSYRLVRFDSLENNRKIAEALNNLRRQSRPLIDRALADALRPSVEQASKPAIESFKSWFDRENKGRLGRGPAPADAQVIVDYGRPSADGWLPDGVSFGLQPALAGDLRVEGNAAHPSVRLVERAAVEKDPIWDGLRVPPATETEPGALAGAQRAGLTIRTPTFALTTGKLYYLVRGSGQAYAAVDEHALIAGPLHGQLVQALAAGDHFRWICHDLSSYRGQRTHVEFTARPDRDFAVAMVVQAEQAPIEVDPPSRLMLHGLGSKEPGSAAEPARRYEALLRTVVDRLGSDGIVGSPDARDCAEIINWLLAHPQLFPQEERAASRLHATARQLLEEEARLRRRIQFNSRLAIGIQDANGVDECVFVRGSPKALGPLARRRFLEALAGPEALAISHGSGRLELARQMIDPARDPFIVRVLVNRVWYHLFGRGLVASVDNFGVLGEPPTHPELLDYLAGEFVRQGWSIKRLVRTLVMSRTYAMSSHADSRADAIDPQNLLLHGIRLRRLEGEAIRDALLAVSGRLDERAYGPPVPVHLNEFQDGRGRPASGPLDGDGRRSVYLAVRRNFLPSFLLAFDTPIPFSTVGHRTVSNVPAQALILMNDPFVHQQAKRWARKVLAQGGSAEARIMGMYESAFGRPPRADELAACLTFLERSGWQASFNRDPAGSAAGIAQEDTSHSRDAVRAPRWVAVKRGLPPVRSEQEEAAWADLAHALFNVKEFIYLH